MKLAKRAWRKMCVIAWQLKMWVYYGVLKMTGKFPPPQSSEPPSRDKVIYLTFDDGPCKYTEQLLDILSRCNIRATFFVTNRVTHLDKLTKIAAGHTVGNHTANHIYRELYANEESFLNALCQMEDIILEKTGIRTTLFRFPGGSMSINRHTSQKDMPLRLIQLLQDRGYRYIDWDIDSRDTADARTPGAVFKNVISGVRNRPETVVLQYEIKKFSVSAVEAIIVWGLKNGYTFFPLE